MEIIPVVALINRPFGDVGLLVGCARRKNKVENPGCKMEFKYVCLLLLLLLFVLNSFTQKKQRRRKKKKERSTPVKIYISVSSESLTWQAVTPLVPGFIKGRLAGNFR